MSLLNYEALEALQAIVQCGSFEKAARSLHITQSAVSQRLRSLEDQLGQLLLVRDVPPRPTQAGRLLLNHVTQVKRWESEVLDSLQQEASSEFASLAVGVNADSLATWFLDALRPTIKKHPLLIELVVEDEHYTDELLRRGEVSATVSAKSHPPLGCDSTALGTVRYYCVATRAFKDRYFSQGFTERAVERAPTVLFSRKDSLHSRFLREKFSWSEVSYPFSLVPSSDGFASWVEAGLAYGLVPEPQCRDALRSKKLINLTPQKFMEFDLFYHAYRAQPPYAVDFQQEFVKQAHKLLRRLS
jgi:LysR family transcriptional regulator (chromosome initiation inhibitor)